jgi:predicted nucleotidyltransferase
VVLTMPIEDIEGRLRRFFAADHHGAAAVYLYGSVARGAARADSDVDIGILFSEDPPRTLEGLPLALEAALEELLGTAVQVVALNRASPDFIHRVLRDGRLVLDRDRARRIRFEVQARNEFFDLQPILRRYREPRGPRATG